MPQFMIVLISYISLLNLFWITKCLFLRNMEPLSLALCYFVLVFFSPFSIAITSLGEERANLSAFRMFVRSALVWFCGTPWTFFYLFFLKKKNCVHVPLYVSESNDV